MPDPCLWALLYGPSGTGKTPTACITAPAHDEPVILLSLEKGTASIAGSRSQGRDINVYELETIHELSEAVSFFCHPQRREKMQGRTIVIDSITRAGENTAHRIAGGKLQIQDYNNLLHAAQCVLLDLQRADWIHRIVIAGVDAAKEGNNQVTMPHYPGIKAGLRLPGYFDTVILSELDNGSIVWRTKVSDSAVARCRLAQLDETEKPDFAALYQKMVKKDD